MLEIQLKHIQFVRFLGTLTEFFCWVVLIVLYLNDVSYQTLTGIIIVMVIMWITYQIKLSKLERDIGICTRWILWPFIRYDDMHFMG